MPETDLNLLIDAARASGEIARRFWKKNPDAWEKNAGAGPVTEADLAIDRMLRSDLLAARPDHGWLSEETEDNTARLDHDAVFIVDPIDGTRAFIEGAETFSHSLAIARAGQVTAAVVYLPILDLMFTASTEDDARLNGAAIRSADCETATGATLLAHQRNYDAANWIDGVPEFDRQFRSSLAYRLCLVAAGDFDAMLALRGTWEWDVAAGDLIATRAGATVTDKFQNRPVYNRPHPRLRGIVAAGPCLHSDITRQLSVSPLSTV